MTSNIAFPLTDKISFATDQLNPPSIPHRPIPDSSPRVPSPLHRPNLNPDTALTSPTATSKTASPNSAAIILNSLRLQRHHHLPSPLKKFQIHPSLARFTIPLSQLAEKPINTKKEIWVGLIIVGKSTRVDQGDNLRNDIGGGDERGEGMIVLHTDRLRRGIPSGSNSSQPRLVPAPTALLIRPSPSIPTTELELKSTSTPNSRDDWDLPSIPIRLDVDGTLLDSVDRCAREMTGRGVREISRCLGRREIVLRAGDNESVRNETDEAVSKVESQDRPKSSVLPTIRQAVRYDFMVKLLPGAIVVPVGIQGRWAGTDESFRVMCRLPKEAVLVRSE